MTNSQNNTKLLQVLIDGQSDLKKNIKELKEQVLDTEKKLTKRIDVIGLQVASLEDNAPTFEEFDELNARVKILENNFIVN